MEVSPKQATYTVVALVVVGFGLIFLAWNGAAARPATPAQIPYLISGGLGGLGVVGAGLVLLRIQQARKDALMLAEKLDALIVALDQHALGPTAVPAPGENAVVAGRTAYHRLDCRLVEGRDNLQRLGPEDAREKGLEPCRVCRPDEAAA